MRIPPFATRIAAIALALLLVPLAAPPAFADEVTPGAIATLAATPRSGGIDLTWEQPSSFPPTPSGASAHYEVTIQPGGFTETTVFPRTDFNGLTNGQPYMIEIRAVSGEVAGPTSTFGPFVPFGAPGTPRNVRATERDRTLTVTWDPPASDGGDAVGEYEVQIIIDGRVSQRESAGATRSYVYGPLENGFTGEIAFAVRANNRGGDSAWSVQSTPVHVRYVPPEAVRVAGIDRYATAAGLSRGTFDAGVPVVYLASGAGFADALSGGPAAAAHGGPLLLTTPTALSPAAAAELDRLNPDRIVVLGGRGTISDTVLSQARRYTSGRVDRIAGIDRYATSAAVSADAFSPGVDAVYIATGEGFVDALGAAPAAVKSGGPVLLSRRTSIPPAVIAEIKRLKPKLIMLVGADPSLSDSLLAVIEPLAPSVGKAPGDDRFQTAEMMLRGHVWASESVFVASGMNWPDALAAAPAAAAEDAVLLLTRPDVLVTYASDVLVDTSPSRLVVAGGPTTITPRVEEAAQAYMRW